MTTTATAEVRPAIKRAVADHPGRAARSLRSAERSATTATTDSERERNAALAAEFRQALADAHRCRRCGREIEHPDSVRDGLGRECVTKGQR